MHATQPVRPPLSSASKIRCSSKHPSRGGQSHRRRSRGIALEMTAKIAVNALLAIAATSSLAKLLPYHKYQQEKLQQIQLQVQVAEKRIHQLSEDFSRYFDPQQAQSIMQEQSHRAARKQRQIVWLNPD
ncbi:MAG: hypothetical protein F6K19_30190 [Cyanothece sp. SIO1E1]|nr:hypothetical protein [Cyanothece sp. SIO1E1]